MNFQVSFSTGRLFTKRIEAKYRNIIVTVSMASEIFDKILLTYDPSLHFIQNYSDSALNSEYQCGAVHYQTAIRVQRRRGRLPLEKWPKVAFSCSIAQIHISLSTKEGYILQSKRSMERLDGAIAS